VVGVFSSGFYEFDDGYAYASIASVQKMPGSGDVVSAIELNLDDLNRSPEIARNLTKLLDSRLTATSWQEQNAHLFDALRSERIVTIIIIGLIELVAALNILIVLVITKTEPL
jgi:lipoprotein-releasing system permease protein